MEEIQQYIKNGDRDYSQRLHIHPLLNSIIINVMNCYCSHTFLIAYMYYKHKQHILIHKIDEWKNNQLCEKELSCICIYSILAITFYVRIVLNWKYKQQLCHQPISVGSVLTEEGIKCLYPEKCWMKKSQYKRFCMIFKQKNYE